METLTAKPKQFYVSPHLFAMVAAETPHALHLAINRMVGELGIEVIQSGESLQQVAHRVRPHNQIVADQIERCRRQWQMKLA